jgi:hypothetical protein
MQVLFVNDVQLS